MSRNERIPEGQTFPLTRYQKGIATRDAIERLLDGEWKIASHPIVGTFRSSDGAAWHWFLHDRVPACNGALKIMAANGECAYSCGVCSDFVDQYFPDFAKRRAVPRTHKLEESETYIDE